jgi:hypothetical protein
MFDYSFAFVGVVINECQPSECTELLGLGSVNGLSSYGEAESVSKSGNLDLNGSVAVNSGAPIYTLYVFPETGAGAVNSPEPSTLLMASSGALVMVGVLRRKLV